MIKQSHKKLIAIALTKNPNVNLAFNAPVLPQEIDALEAIIGKNLPQDFKDFYLISNGNASNSVRLFNGLRLLNVTEMMEIWQSMKTIKASGAFVIDGIAIKADTDIEIKSDWWNENWLPITDNMSGDYLMIDCDPTDKGSYGQVFNFWHDASYRSLEATSFENFIKQTINYIASDKLKYAEDYNGFIAF